MRFTSSKQDREFIEAIIPTTILEEAITGVCDKFSPEDVFDTAQLEN